MRVHHGLFLGALLALAGCVSTGPTGVLAADAPRALPASGPVSVSWNDPATFTEFTQSSNRWAASEGNWLQDLAEYMRKRAQLLLAPGERLDLTIIDLNRAGQYEPWHGPQLQDARIVRDMYPPKMTVGFRLIGANGAVMAEGERKISDQAFLLNASPLNNTDALRYEKRMVDAWLRSELGSAKR